jgi:adenine-specific DNA-methyltransferase
MFSKKLNFVTTSIWQKKYGAKSDSKFLSESHEFIVCYARNIEKVALNRLPRSDEQDARYRNPDGDERGIWTSGDLLRNEVRDYAIYEIVGPTGKKHWPPKGTSWRFTKDKFAELRADRRIWFGEKGDNVPRLKRFLSEVAKTVPATTWWEHSEVGHSDEATKELRVIFADSDKSYSTPKPVRLLTRILAIGANDDSIILDSFAGSGTTAHAVLALNKEDGGNRRFILCQMPYETKEQEKRGENICDGITAERVRRVIRGVPKASDENLRKGSGGTFSYFKLGKALRLRAILEGSDLPDYESLASYVFFTATGEEFNAKKMKRGSWFIGESRRYDVFLMYEPDADKLKSLALTLDVARDLPSVSGKQKLVFAPTKYLDPYFLDSLRITFQQLPYQIYKALET